jgi:carbon-monoxide dehydrogenase small subunit
MNAAKVVRLTVNGREREASVPPNETLLETLRGFACFEVKSGCEKGDCGACAVLIDGEAVDSCLTLTWTVEGAHVTTVSGLGSVDAPHPLQKAFIERGAAQCGYCTPGLIIAAQSMLDNDTRDPSEDDIRLALSGNLCRCTGYTKVFDAVGEAARIMREGE